MDHMHKKILICLVILNGICFSQLLPIVAPQTVGMDGAVLSRLDSVINNAITNKQTPGAVALVARQGKIVYRKAFGYSQLIPEKKEMKIDAVFDLASVTKPMATATSIMILVERGQLRLMDAVSNYIPDFNSWQDEESGEKSTIRIWHLLTHTSGLPPYAPVNDLKQTHGAPNPEGVIEHISKVKRHSPPATKFTYSCLNFITLQKIVEVISGQGLDKFSVQNIFKPLNMKHTEYKPDVACAVTEVIDGKPLDGTVHDPLARVMMDCVSGNAGLFSTADDMSVFAQMMLQNGVYNDVRILSPLTVKTMITVPEKVHFAGRALGWDVDSPYSSNGGDLFPYGSYGHTGYTGTSLWIDPMTQTFVILLTNRVHPDDSASVVRLRSLVANIVAASIINLD
jgi:CubicO group peptidase (beta-lactamase class C family)